MSAGPFNFQNWSGSRFLIAPQGKEFPLDLVLSRVACTVDATAVGVCGRRCDSGKPVWPASSLWTLHLGKLHGDTELHPSPLGVGGLGISTLSPRQAEKGRYASDMV